MLQTIRKRLQALEQAQRNTDIPILVFIHRDEVTGRWIAVEQYMKKNVPQSGTQRKISLNCPDSYESPKGFSGSIFLEEELLD